MPEQSYYALDADVLLALADGNECAQGLIDYFMAQRCHPIVTFSVLTHLQDIAENEPEWAELARKALSERVFLGVLEPSLTETERDLAELTAEELVSRGLVDSFSFAFAISEAALFGADYFVTAQHESAMAVKDKYVNFVLQARGQDSITVLSPQFIAEVEADEEEAGDEI